MFAAIDRMIGALTERFSSNAPEFIAFVTVNPWSKSFLSFSDVQPVAESFSYLGVDVVRLRGQTSVASNMFTNAGPEHQVTMQCRASSLCSSGFAVCVSYQCLQQMLNIIDLSIPTCVFPDQFKKCSVHPHLIKATLNKEVLVITTLYFILLSNLNVFI